MENVVYILGAGFSQPLGIPTVSDFLEKAHDLLERDSSTFGYFEDVFLRIKELAVAKTFYDVNVENIEEVLSMLEMMEYAGPSTARLEVQRFIRDVIEAYTPAIANNPKAASEDLIEWVFGDGHVAKLYGLFMAGLCGLRPEGMAGHNPGVRVDEVPPAKYSVVSLNYDCALESAFGFLRDNWQVPEELGFARYPTKAGSEPLGRCLLTKLHGSVSEGAEGIVPPTWNKGRRSHILRAWQQAYEALSRANRIRIIGYSLPENDAYFRYLLKSAATRSRNLKSVHVLCKDDDESVKRRYEAFVAPNKLTFRNGVTVAYLGSLPECTKLEKRNDVPVQTLTIDLETNHLRTFGKL